VAILSGLRKIGSMADSLGVYVPAMVFQKAIGLLRVLLFAHILREAQAQYGLWGLAMMVFSLAAPVATLGANHGLTRYASLYEASGQLSAFYRRLRWGCVILAAAVTGVMLLASRQITSWVFASGRAADGITYHQQMQVCWVTLANVLAGALYFNMLALAAGLRAYRIVSAVELLFSLALTVVGVAVLAVWPAAMALLLGHLACLVISLVAGMVLLDRAIYDLAARSRSASPQAGEPAAAGVSDEPPGPGGAMRKVFGFGLVAMVGNMLWLAAQYVSFYLTNRRFTKADAGVFAVFMQFGQVVLLAGNAAWAVIFSHVAGGWESGDRKEAVGRLETAFKAVTLVLTAMALAVYAAGPVWVKLLPPQYRTGLCLLGGLLMFFQAMANFSLVTVIARLRERPGLIALAAVASIAANVALAVWWMPKFAYGPLGAAWAAGAGVYVGSGLVTVAYFLIGRIRLHPASCLLLASPVVLALPAWMGLATWAVLATAAVWTHWFFAADERRMIRSAVGGAVEWARKVVSWR